MPICEDGTTTIKEAFIISTILSKYTIPSLHTSAALIFICQLSYNSSRAIILRAIIDKKYSFPNTILETLKNFFLDSSKLSSSMPVLWHQCLLVFTQRYGKELSPDQKICLKEISASTLHPSITPLILECLNF